MNVARPMPRFPVNNSNQGLMNNTVPTQNRQPSLSVRAPGPTRPQLNQQSISGAPQTQNMHQNTANQQFQNDMHRPVPAGNVAQNTTSMQNNFARMNLQSNAVPPANVLQQQVPIMRAGGGESQPRPLPSRPSLPLPPPNGAPAVQTLPRPMGQQPRSAPLSTFQPPNQPRPGVLPQQTASIPMFPRGNQPRHGPLSEPGRPVEFPQPLGGIQNDAGGRGPTSFPRNLGPNTSFGRPSAAFPRPQLPSQPHQLVGPRIELDLNCNCSDSFKFVTVSKFPSTSAVHEQSSIPLACIIQPLADLGDGAEVPVINFGNVGVVRCKRCRAYMNPFVTWLDNGRRWQCNLCSTQNETPANYYRHLDDKQQRVDKYERKELSEGCVEIIAPSEYMVRPPMPPVYVFCMEVSQEARSSGMLQAAVQSIRDALDFLPGSPRTQVGFLAYDDTVYFYNLRSDLETPQMLAIPELDELFLPLPEELLVNLSDSRKLVDKLLDSLERVYGAEQTAGTPFPSHGGSTGLPKEMCLGSAINAAYSIMAHIGGKLCVFVHRLPSLAAGKLSVRGNSSVLGIPTEHHLLNAANDFYKNKALEFTRQQICCELFIFVPQTFMSVSKPGAISLPPAPQVGGASSSYVDVASLSELSKYSGGDCHYYGGDSVQAETEKLKKDLHRVLTRTTAWEAVMRVRASNGVVPRGFYGNFLLRGSDLMALPNASSDSTFGVEFGFDAGTTAPDGTPAAPGAPVANPNKDLMGLGGDTLSQAVTIQTALLYTNSIGERRIRVLTSVVPLTKSVQEVMLSAKMDPIVNLFAKKGVDIALKTGFDDIRRKLHLKCVDIIKAYKSFNTVIGKNVPSESNNQQARAGMPLQPVIIPPTGPTKTIASPPKLPPSVGGNGVGVQVNVDLLLPPNLVHLPQNVLGMIKANGYRGGADVSLDTRSYLFDIMSRMTVDISRVMFHPCLYDLINPGSQKENLDWGSFMKVSPEQDGAKGKFLLPEKLNLATESLRTDSILFMDTGIELYLWVGMNVLPIHINDIFSTKSINNVNDMQLVALLEAPPPQNSPDKGLKRRVYNLIQYIRTKRHGTPYIGVTIVRENGRNERSFRAHLFQDRQQFNGGTMDYDEFLQSLLQQSSSQVFRR